ncbi:MAG: DUF5991 domain-containing protein, partial [Bacillota bacterium]|nr:DUF5991 domain-containing protein [Bacillota bacterium]
MKKGIAIALLFVFTLLCFGFTGCSKGQNNQITEPTIATTTVSDNNTTTPADEQKEEMSNRTGNKENAPASLSLESWVGDYMFSEHADPDENMFYSITVYKQDTVYYAQISIDGFQTLKRLQAKAYGD